MDNHNWPLILIIEDDDKRQWYYNKELEVRTRGRIAFLKAHDLEAAQKLFTHNTEQIDLIVVDEQLPESNKTGELIFSDDFVRIIRQSFKGPIIAAPDNHRLRLAGCDYWVNNKDEVPDKVIKVLDL